MMASIALSLVLASQTPAEAANSPFDGSRLVTEATAGVRGMAYRAKDVDWAALETELHAMAASATDTVDMLPVYHRLVQALGDGHSFVSTSDANVETYVSRHGRDPFEVPSQPPATSTFKRRDMVDHHAYALPSGKWVQWIAVSKTFGAGQKAQDYAAHLFMATADVPAGTCGYIVDVRGNTGGNIWPMLTGLSGLLGDGPSNGQTNADGSVTVYAELREGAAIIVQDTEGRGNTLIRSSAWRSLPPLAQAPVAVLTDDATASSGEGVAVAFRGRPNTRSFGKATWGSSTANSGLAVGDGVELWVTVGVMTDRDGTAYPDGLTPDEIVDFHPGADGAADTQLGAATAWLATQPGCAATN